MPFNRKQLEEIFGFFFYREDQKVKGTVIIDPKWIEKNIVRIETPYGRFPCHRQVAYQIKMFIDGACTEGLVTDIGGIWVPRHVLWDPKKPLSGHAYGCDIDINVDDGKDGKGGRINYGDNSYQPPRLLELAKKWGFEWGGSRRSSKDGMHFSCIRLIKEDATKPPLNRLSELRLGLRGEEIRELQRRLNTKGYNLKVDGIFGAKTAFALMDWQKQNDFKASGRTDIQTWKSLGRI